MTRRLARIPLVAGSVLAVATLISPAAAQVQMVTVEARSGFGGGGQTNRINTGNVNKYAELLSLDSDQRMIADELLKGYTTEMQEAERGRRETVQRLMAEFREFEDHSVLRDEMPKAMNDFRERAEALERQFFNDLRLVLGDSQLDRWERVERLRRRETVLSRGAISGETVDLIAVSDVIGVEDSEDVRAALMQYEADLDRLLMEKQRMLDEAAENRPSPGEFDLEAMQAGMQASREMGLKISELNQRFARRLESLLSGDASVQFADEVKKRTFPTVYRESFVDRLIKATESLEDLRDDQASALAEIRLSYGRARAAADDRWAGAIRERDESGEGGGFFAGGMMIRMDVDEEEGDDPVSEAKTARRELDQRFEEKVLAVLSPAQKEKMPARGEDQERGNFVIDGAGGPTGVFIQRGGGI